MRTKIIWTEKMNMIRHDCTFCPKVTEIIFLHRRTNLTVFCCLLDASFILWGVMAETHEVKPVTHQNNRAVFFYTVHVAICCLWTKGASLQLLSSQQLTMQALSHPCWVWQELMVCVRRWNTWHSALKKTREQDMWWPWFERNGYHLRVRADELDIRRLNLCQSFCPTVTVRKEGKKKFHKMSYSMESETSVITPYPRKWMWKQKSFFHTWFFGKK